MFVNINSSPFADAHADSLLWNRDLCNRSKEGHLDFPRLVESGVRVQIFTIPTRGWPIVDGMRLFCTYRGWPRHARKSARTRAIYQIEMLQNACARSGGTVGIVRTRQELETNLSKGKVSAIVGLEGAYPLEGKLASLREFWDLGVRYLGPAHLIPNAFSSCSFWIYQDRGLSALGRELLNEMARLGMGVDAAHASPRALDDMLSDDIFKTSPKISIFTSHTGVAGATRHWRNLSDTHLLNLTKRRGIISIILARMYLGGRSIENFVKHVRHAASIAGFENVAIGSDFDGFVKPPEGIRDVTDFRRAADALLQSGIAPGDVAGVAGGNLIRYLNQTLPQ
ncbi:MAG: dipeptidase [Planctomycetota bacterium]